MRALSSSALLLVGMLGGFGLAACGKPGNSCSTDTCGGCCDSDGKCQPGTSVMACGIDGTTCGRCGSGTVCNLGECAVLGGNGGGGGTPLGGGTATGGGVATGGGAATGGGGGGGTASTGGGSGCREVSLVTVSQATTLTADYVTFNGNNGFYNRAIFLFAGQNGTIDSLRVEVVYADSDPNPPTPPLTQSFRPVGYRDCTVCAAYGENCQSDGTCAQTYLARSGSVTITQADRNASAGHLAGSASNVHFEGWDLPTDTAVGTACVNVTSVAPFDIHWPL